MLVLATFVLAAHGEDGQVGGATTQGSLHAAGVRPNPVGDSLIRNGDFAAGGQNWGFSSEGKGAFEHRFEPVEGGEGQWLVIETKPGAEIGFSRAEQALAEVPKGPVKLVYRAASEGVDGGNGAYAYLEFLNAGGQRISGLQGDFAPKTGGSERISLAGEVPEGTTRAVLRLILHGRGTARFTDVSLVEMDEASREFASAATLTVTDRPVGGAIFGMGAEDDGWAYTQGNAAKGWSEEDSALREKRLRWLQPSFIRSFIWTHDWLPGAFWQGEDGGYLFGEDKFQSKLRTWRLYKEIGAEVKLAQVSWAQGGIWKIPERHIRAIGDLFEYLHKEQGLENIKYYSVANEPNHSMVAHGGTFDIYTRYHEGIAEQFQKRGLDASLVGSDDGDGSAWFRQSAEAAGIKDNTAFFASHTYIPFPILNSEMVDKFFEDRMGILDELGVHQPFVVTEFGFTGSGTNHFQNPYMAEPDYALAAMDFVLRGLNRGARGFCFWTMHEMVYPPYKHKPNSHWNEIMTWALWDFEGNLKPVYHAAALMMRNMRPGMPVYPVKSDTPGTAQATRVGDKVFWVNLSPEPVEITLEGFAAGQVGILLADNQPGDTVAFNEQRDIQSDTDRSAFSVPGRSYGAAW